MGPFPIITERLLLREFRPDDEAAIHAYASDPEVTRYTVWGPNDPPTTSAVLAGWLAGQAVWPRRSVPLAIERREDARLVGATGFDIDWEARTAVLGYVLHRDYWGFGYATEAVRAQLEFGFTTFRLHRMKASVDTRNPRSSHVLEKLGLRCEALFRKDALKHGHWRDTYLYAILEEEWRDPGAALRTGHEDLNPPRI